MATLQADPTLRGRVRPLLFPRSVVLVGASDRTYGQAEAVRNVLRGRIPAWGVNPKRDEVLGLPCAPRVADLPEIPELAFLLVGHGRVEEAFEEAAAAGVRAFVLPGLGNEAGVGGRPIAERIAARAVELGASVIGPNCMGVAVAGKATSCWIGTVPESFATGHVAVVSHSGSIAEALVSLGPRIGFRCVVSCGAEIARDAADLVAFLAEDQGTRAVGLFLEAVRRPAAFARALELLAEAEKPVACLKVGRSRAGARAALTHTGAIVGSERAFSALLCRHGAIEVDDFPTLVETLEVLGRKRRPRGRRVAAISESGGEGALLADHGEAAGMPFEPLPPVLGSQLQSEFPNYLDPGNPLDAWAIDEADRVYPRSLELLAGSGAYDVLLAQIDLSQWRGASEAEWCAMIVRALADTVEGTEIFPAVASVQTADPPPEVAALARDRDVALLRGSRTAMRALAAVARWKPPRPTAVENDPVDLTDLLTVGALPEYESTLVLERYGIPVAPRRRASSPEEAVAAARELGFPVVVKADGPAHKAAAGGVILGLVDETAVAGAAERLGGRVLVARQAGPGPEAFCGLTRDPQYGPVLAVGPGGSAVEALSLAAVTLAPVGLEEARALVADAPGLADDEALARVLVALGRLAVDHPEVAAVDVNPLILSADGAVAVDALVVVEPEGKQ
ncbi:MAG: acetate--CoA ligase family protein [Gaiellaceae bacterium]